VLCHGAATGEVDLTATGGTAPYTFAWSNGSSTEDITGLIAGVYTVVVTDDNGCVDSLSATITEPAAPLALTATTVDVLCHGAATGEVDLTATGGTAPYTFAWSNGATSEDIINLIAGTYTVIVTDDNGCVDSLSATITEPAAPLALTATTVDVLCHGAATGEVDLTATGGTAPYSYAWSNGATTQDIINLDSRNLHCNRNR
jgi:type III secretion system FlhB-like substrate exporter